MLDRFTRLCFKLTNRLIVGFGLLLFTVFMIWVLPAEAVRSSQILKGEPTPDTSFFYTASDLYAMAEAYGVEGRAYYIHARYTFDLAWPLAYVMFLVPTTAWLLKPWEQDRKKRLLVLVPLAGFLFDLLENAGAVLVMSRYPARTWVIDWLVPWMTMFKWSALAAAFVIMLISAWFRLKTMPDTR